MDEIDSIPYDFSWPAAVAPWAEVVVRLEVEPAARLLYDLLLPHAEQVITVQAICQGTFAHYLGMLATMLGRYHEAHDHFARADDIHRRLRAPFHRARTQVEWAALLHRRNEGDDATRAVALLDAALDLARRHGCGSVESASLALASSSTAGGV